MERIDVSIMGRDFSLACNPEEKQKLLSAVRLADQLMLKIKGSGGMTSASNERIAVMACIQMASDLLSVKSADEGFGGMQYGQFKSKIEELNTLLDSGLNDLKKL